MSILKVGMYASSVYAIPLTGKFYDFEKQRFFDEGKATTLENIADFYRSTSATYFEAGELNTFAADVPRISSKGLLIEPQATNLFKDSQPSVLTGWLPAEGILAGSAISPTGDLDGVAIADGGYIISTSGSTNLDPLLSPARLSTFLKCQGTVEFNSFGQVGGVSKATSQILTLSSPTWSRVFNSFTEGFSTPMTHRIRFQRPTTEFDVYGYSVVQGLVDTSYIPTPVGATATRTKDTLILPLALGETISGDWDAGVTLTQTATEATFEGHGYIRNIKVTA